MPKKLLKRYIPDPAELRQNKYLKVFARFLEDPNLFHMNRRSVSNAFLVGLFWAMIPMPFQMVPATITALLIRGINWPIAVALVWVSNPITMPPMFYFNYLVGTWILGEPENSRHLKPASSGWLSSPRTIGCICILVVSLWVLSQAYSVTLVSAGIGAITSLKSTTLVAGADQRLKAPSLRCIVRSQR